MGWKTVEEMSGSEVVNEAEGLVSYAERCREIEQGINTKEVMRFRACMDRIEAERLDNPAHIVELHRRWDPRLSPDQQRMMLSIFKVGGTMAGMRALFAPA